ncbi:hypothetical protein PO909_021653, partial [Leuciscus waleckii]
MPSNTLVFRFNAHFTNRYSAKHVKHDKNKQTKHNPQSCVVNKTEINILIQIKESLFPP